MKLFTRFMLIVMLATAWPVAADVTPMPISQGADMAMSHDCCDGSADAEAADAECCEGCDQASCASHCVSPALPLGHLCGLFPAMQGERSHLLQTIHWIQSDPLFRPPKNTE
ncbi:hypothetical protein [Bowmanella denitrificans]|uniref:hypothetical protein n=1 Tax=Bowmanella denitrificans TaxID=366582 RepID=UPI0011AF7212|nr:hypothetical protein [Bowmanella denitrificans]